MMAKSKVQMIEDKLEILDHWQNNIVVTVMEIRDLLHMQSAPLTTTKEEMLREFEIDFEARAVEKEKP